MQKGYPKAIIALGRGIGKDNKGIWHPTGYYETLGNGQHTGILQKKPDQKNPDTVIGGGKINTLAAFYLYKKYCESAHPPKFLIFAAGRPDYLNTTPKQVREGLIMKQEFLRLVKKHELPSPRCLILSKNKNTHDDVERSLAVLIEKKITYALMVTVRLHIPRTKEFLRLAQEMQKNNDRVSIDFIASEDVMSTVSTKYKALFESALMSLAYKRTAKMEKRGLKALRLHSYNLKH